MDALTRPVIDFRTIGVVCPTCKRDDLIATPKGYIEKHMSQPPVVVGEGEFRLVVGGIWTRCGGSRRRLPHIEVSCDACGFHEDAYGDKDADDAENYHSDMMSECEETPKKKVTK